MIPGEYLVAALIMLSIATLYGYMVYYVANDARQRGSDVWYIHGIGALLFNLPYVGLYFIIAHD